MNAFRLMLCLPLLIALSGLAASPAAADPVYVQGAEMGAGYTVSNGSTCFLVVPLHVLRPKMGDGRYDETAEGSFEVRDVNGVRALGELKESFVDFDLAVGEISNPGTLRCPKQWPDGRQLAGTLRTRGAVTVRQVGRTRNETAIGAVVRELDGTTYMRIEPGRPSDSFQQGMSGSLIESSGQVAGMLMEREASGLGKVLRQNQIHALIGSIVMEPLNTRIALGVAPFTYQQRSVDSGTSAMIKVIDANPRLQAIPLSTGARHNGLTVQGVLMTMVRTTAPNPKYVRQTRSNGLGNLIARATNKKGTDTDSRNIVTVTYEISWKVLRPDGTIYYQDSDRRQRSIGQNFFEMRVTDVQWADEVIAESIAAILPRVPL